jgi:hypothetical protein
VGCDRGLLTWLVAKAPLFTAAAAIIGAVIAVLGFRKWHPETTGKRKIELAEDILAGAYEAGAVIAWTRMPSGFAGEGETWPRVEGEDPDETRIRDSYYRVVERLNRDQNVFTTLEAKKYRAMAYFGKPVEQPFQDLRALNARIVSAASNLIRAWPPGTSR